VHGLHRMASQTEKLRSDWQNIAIQYSQGCLVMLSQDGIHAKKKEASRLPCGQAIWFRAGDTNTIVDFGHYRLIGSMPVLLDPTGPMFRRRIHHDHSSPGIERYKTGRTKGFEPLTAEERALFKTRFNVDEDAVIAMFAAEPGLQDPRKRLTHKNEIEAQGHGPALLKVKLDFRPIAIGKLDGGMKAVRKIPFFRVFSRRSPEDQNRHWPPIGRFAFSYRLYGNFCAKWGSKPFESVNSVFAKPWTERLEIAAIGDEYRGSGCGSRGPGLPLGQMRGAAGDAIAAMDECYRSR